MTGNAGLLRCGCGSLPNTIEASIGIREHEHVPAAVDDRVRHCAGAVGFVLISTLRQVVEHVAGKSLAWAWR